MENGKSPALDLQTDPADLFGLACDFPLGASVLLAAWLSYSDVPLSDEQIALLRRGAALYEAESLAFSRGERLGKDSLNEKEARAFVPRRFAPKLARLGPKGRTPASA